MNKITYLSSGIVFVEEVCCCDVATPKDLSQQMMLSHASLREGERERE